jgi:hypothetical protein
MRGPRPKITKVAAGAGAGGAGQPVPVPVPAPPAGGLPGGWPVGVPGSVGPVVVLDVGSGLCVVCVGDGSSGVDGVDVGESDGKGLSGADPVVVGDGL